MGGNALKGFVERKNKEEHQKVVSKVLLFLSKFTKAEEVKYINNKESFGDADIVVQYQNDKKFDWMIDDVVDNFKPNAATKNSNVFSFEVDGHQVDLIFTEKKFYNSSLTYFANNDLGNLVGRIAHKLGFKYGHKGLVYVLREGDKVIGEIEVTQDQNEIMKFLGFDSLKTEFETLEEIFEYVASSKYFDPDIYLLHNRNHVSRVRDVKRETYNKFLKWCEEHPDKKKYTFDESVKDYLKMLSLAEAFHLFEGFEKSYDRLIQENEYQKKLKTLFNGEIVSKLTELSGKELGAFMKFTKEDFRTEGRLFFDNEGWILRKFGEYNESK